MPSALTRIVALASCSALLFTAMSGAAPARATTPPGMLLGAGKQWHQFFDVAAVAGGYVTAGQWIVDVAEAKPFVYHPEVAKFASDGTLVWTRTLDTTDGWGSFESVAALTDGSIVAVGKEKPADVASRGTEYLVAKFSAAGNLLWRKSLGGPQDEGFNAVQPTSDGGFVAVGQAVAQAVPYSAHILRFDADGDTVWSDTVTGARFEDVAVLPNGDYLAAGMVYWPSTDFPTAGLQGLTVSYTSDGKRIRGKQFTSTGENGFVAVAVAADGNVIAAAKPTVLKLNASSGSEMWSKNVNWTIRLTGLGLPNRKYQDHYVTLSGITAMSDGGFLAVGFVDSRVSSELDTQSGLAVRFTKDGNKVWVSHLTGDFGTYTSFEAALDAGDGKTMVAGTTDMYSRGSGVRSAILTPLSTNGTPSWVATSLLPKFTKTKAPKITGTAKVGRKLHITKGTWSPQVTSWSYQWLRNGKPIAGANSSTYRLTKSDKGKKVSVRLTAHRSGYQVAARTSSATKKVKR